MTEYKKNKIPTISAERLNTFQTNTIVGNSKEERAAHAFLKGKELTQPFTIRIPKTLYQELRKIAFDRNEKINQIIVKLIKEYTVEK